MVLHKKNSLDSSPSLSALGGTIRTMRKRYNLTQQELADQSNCGITLINQLEMGKQTLRLDKLLSVLSVLGLQIKIESGKKGLISEIEE